MADPDSTPAEQWQQIPGYEPFYSVSNLGRVRSIRRWQDGRILKPYMVGGYAHATLFLIGRHGVFIHRLVLMAFVGPRPAGMQANHKNGNRSDNRLANLEWVTPSENSRHMYHVLGRRQKGGFAAKPLRGVAHPKTKLTPEDVRAIRERYAPGKYGSRRRLAAEFGVAGNTIWCIATRRIWRDL